MAIGYLNHSDPKFSVEIERGPESDYEGDDLLKVNVLSADAPRGWTMADSAKVLSISTPSESTGLYDQLPLRKRGWSFWQVPADFPLGLPHRPCAKVTEGHVELFTKKPEEKLPEIQLTGRIGTLVGMTLITDGFKAPARSKYMYLLVHVPKGVKVYVFERDQNNRHYVFEYRSAREARVDMKRYRIPLIGL